MPRVRMMIHRKVWLACLVCCAVGVARGQVRPIQDGRRLDASFRVGSGGVNAPVSAPNPMSSQLYVNGQVTGLGAFRGRTGYYPSDALRLRLPSSSVDRFYGQSVGLDAYTTGGAYQTHPYYARSSTAFGVREIAAGLTAPGTSAPRHAIASAPEQRRLLQELLAQYRPLASTGVRYLPTTGVLPATNRDGVRVGGAPGTVPGGALAGTDGRGAGSLFRIRPTGVGREEPTPAVGAPGAATTPGGVGTPRASASPGTSPTDLVPLPSAEPGAMPQPRMPGAALPPPGGDMEPPLTRTGVTRGGMRRQVPGAAEPGSPSAARPGERPGALLKPAESPAAGRRTRQAIPVRRGQDVFLDLMRVLREHARGVAAGEGAAAEKPKTVADFAPRRPTDPAARRSIEHLEMSVADWRTGRKRLTYPESDSEEAKNPLAYVALTAAQRVQINALAGSGKDEFNRFMAAGQAKLKAGRYYDAAAEFERASGVDPRNPLARVGVCLALFCAGEPLTSANYLRRAMLGFPLLARVRVNVYQLAPGPAFRWQIERLRRRLNVPAESRKPMMVFLACFLEVNLRRPAEAKALAARLRDVGKTDPVLKAYAETILQEGTAPTTQPDAAPEK